MNGRDDGSEVERFLDGTMSPEEAREFALHLERDGELRSAVDAERMIRTAVAADLGAMPPVPSGSRARMIRTAESAPAHPQAGPPLPEPHAAVRGTGRMPLLVALLAGALVVALLLIERNADGRSSTSTALPAAGDTLRRADTAPPASAPRSPAPSGSPAAHPAGDGSLPITAAPARDGGPRGTPADSSSPRIHAPAADTLPAASRAIRSDSARVPLTISPTKITRPKEP